MSAVTDQAGAQDAGGNTGDFDDDEGGGLVETFPVFSFVSLIEIISE